MQDFVRTQLYTDQEWRQFLSDTSVFIPTTDSTDFSLVECLRSAIMEGIEVEDAEVENIAGSAEEPTFANTIVALNQTGEKLSRATDVLFNLLSAESSDEMEELANELAPILSEHSNNIMLNVRLYERVKVVNDNPPSNLTKEERMLLDKTYEGFERSGAMLNEKDKQCFRELTSQLSQEELKFSQNLLKETNNFILHLTNEAELEGLPQIHRDAARSEAEIRGVEGWVFTLHAPSYVPFMQYSQRRDLREKLYRAYNTRCTHDNEFCNFEHVRKIVNLRREIAQLLGYVDYADYALRRRMAQTTANVQKLLNDLIEHYLPTAQKEVAEVEQYARSFEGEDFKLMPWDFAYYSQKLKKERYDYDPDMLRPYFELSAVKKGVFGLATQLYGITFEHDKTIPVYHPDVEAYRVYDAAHNFLALLFLDFFPRESKKGGAWMTNYRGEHCDLDAHDEVTPNNSVRPVVSVTTNFTKPTATTPALLTLGEVETFLHEFGHALHGIFAMTHYEALSGTSVYWDFVELPSQFMENFAIEPQFLNTFAKHYQTGENIPEKYIRCIHRSRCFQAAYACMRQVSFGLLDMAYYTQTKDCPQNIKTFEDNAWSRVQLLPSVPEACMTVQFSHIMAGGYAAGYYSYKWAEVLDADAFSLFKQKGIFDADTARSFRENVLSKGGTEEPMKLYMAFRGQAPTIDALLHRDGIQ